jgi:hypothetical protein
MRRRLTASMRCMAPASRCNKMPPYGAYLPALFKWRGARGEHDQLHGERA